MISIQNASLYLLLKHIRESSRLEMIRKPVMIIVSFVPLLIVSLQILRPGTLVSQPEVS